MYPSPVLSRVFRGACEAGPSSTPKGLGVDAILQQNTDPDAQQIDLDALHAEAGIEADLAQFPCGGRRLTDIGEAVQEPNQWPEPSAQRRQDKGSAVWPQELAVLSQDPQKGLILEVLNQADAEGDVKPAVGGEVEHVGLYDLQIAPARVGAGYGNCLRAEIHKHPRGAPQPFVQPDRVEPGSTSEFQSRASLAIEVAEKVLQAVDVQSASTKTVAVVMALQGGEQIPGQHSTPLGHIHYLALRWRLGVRCPGPDDCRGIDGAAPTCSRTLLHRRRSFRAAFQGISWTHYLASVKAGKALQFPGCGLSRAMGGARTSSLSPAVW